MSAMVEHVPLAWNLAAPMPWVGMNCSCRLPMPSISMISLARQQGGNKLSMVMT